MAPSLQQPRRLRRLVFIAPLVGVFLLVSPIVDALKSPGDELYRSYSSSKPSSLQRKGSELGGDKISSSFPSDDGGEGDFLSDISDSEFTFDEDIKSSFSSLKKSGRKSSPADTLDLDKEYEDGENSFEKTYLDEDMPAQGKEAMYEAYNQLHTLAQVSL